MIAVIGEMTVSFRKNGDVWTRRFSGLGYNWAKKLKEEKNDVLLLTVLPFGDLGKEMADDLVSNSIVFDPDMHMPLNPVIEVENECFMRSSSSLALSTERLSDALSYFSDVKSVVVSSNLLSYNPVSSAILDSLSFMYPQPRVAVDTGFNPKAIGQGEMMRRRFEELSSCISSFLATDDKDAILDFLR